MSEQQRRFYNSEIKDMVNDCDDLYTIMLIYEILRRKTNKNGVCDGKAD